MPEPRDTIIVAEDERSSRVLLTRHLEKAGYSVIARPDGASALAAVRELGGGIVIADWAMPELDGVELCRQIRRDIEAGELSFVFYILLTAHSDMDEIVTGLEAGADDYLTKPYHRDELLARLRAGVRIFSLQRELLAANARLTTLASTDALTGVCNRRALFERLESAWSLAERQDGPLACIMLDIDRFKRVNDTYGHAAGDAVLRQIATLCAEETRKHDVIGRFGGEEFCVVCPGTTALGVRTLAERIRMRIESAVVQVQDNEISATVSLGVAVRCAEYNSPDDLLAAADMLLYKAKDAGRNQTWELDASGTPGPVPSCTTAS